MSTDLFDAVKRSVRIGEVLARYGIALPEGHGVVRIPCLLHRGDDPNLAINTTSDTWYCHSRCHIGGDVITLVAELEHVRPLAAARLLEQWFSPASRASPMQRARPEPRQLTPISWSIPRDSAHPILAHFGADAGVVETFGVGYCTVGRFRDRIVFPVEDEHGIPVGFVGRTGTDADPKYLVSQGFARGLTLYNLHRITSPYVFLVEGPRDVWALWRAGHPAIAPIGSSLTERQAELLARFRHVCILFDGDAAGRNGAAQAAGLLAPNCWVRVIRLPDGEDPASLELEVLENLIAQGRTNTPV